VLQERRVLPEQEALTLFGDIMSGFVELIKHGIVHRDLKPANILIH
jgi:serine/threonine protein kinase